MRTLKILFWSAFTVGSIVLCSHGYAVHARSQVRNSDGEDIKSIAKAIASYREKHGRFPPPVLYDTATDTPYSWRVALLPELGLQGLYDLYRRNETWDSQHNSQVLARIPDAYRSATASRDSTTTAYFALTGPDTGFSTTDGESDPHITDPYSSIVMVVSARRDVPWTRPQDIEFDQYGPPPELGGMHEGIFHAAFADGTGRAIAHSISADLFRQMVLACDGWPSGCEY
jgi:hypothetical protein